MRLLGPRGLTAAFAGGRSTVAITTNHMLGARATPASDLADFESWLGKPAEFTHMFCENGNGTTTWAQNLAITQQLVVDYAGLGRRFDWAFPLCSTTEPLAETIAGTHDAVIVQMAQIIAAFDKSPWIPLRLGWEANYFTAYPWSASTAAGPSEYIAAFRRIAPKIRAVSPRFKINWVNGPSTTDYLGAQVNPENHYPGDAYVDLIGMDCYFVAGAAYDTPAGTNAARAFWNKRWTNYSLEWLSAFGLLHNKPISIPEFGMNGEYQEFLVGMAEWLRNKPVTHLGYWNKGVMTGVPADDLFADRLSDDQYPIASAQFIRRWGAITIVTPAAFTASTNTTLDLVLEATKPVTWTIIGGASAALFRITAGALQALSALANGAYVVTVRATDERGVYADRTFTITVSAGQIQPEAQFAIADYTTPPTAPVQAALNTFIAALKAGGAWKRLDAVYVLRNDLQQASLINIMQQTDFDATVSGTVTFTTRSGIAGNGTTGYLDTGFVPSLPGRKFAQDDSYSGIYSTTDLANGAGRSYDFGAVGPGSGGYWIARDNGGTVMGRPSTSATKTIAPASSFPGYVSMSRTGAAAWVSYANGVQKFSGTDTSQPLPYDTFKICAGDITGAQFGVNNIAVALFGQSMSAAQDLAIANAVLAYVAAVT